MVRIWHLQINLYLLSRIIIGCARLAVTKGVIPEPRGPVFPWFGAVVWGVVLWLFEHEPETLQVNYCPRAYTMWVDDQSVMHKHTLITKSHARVHTRTHTHTHTHECV